MARPQPRLVVLQLRDKGGLRGPSMLLLTSSRSPSPTASWNPFSRLSVIRAGLICEAFTVGRGQRKRPSPRHVGTGSSQARATPRSGALPTRTSFSTAHRERPQGLSHFEQTLRPGMPGLPRRTSLEGAGQWPVCHADASPTEVSASGIVCPLHLTVKHFMESLQRAQVPLEDGPGGRSRPGGCLTRRRRRSPWL